MGAEEKELEAILLDYVKRYGLTSKARRHFELRDLPEADRPLSGDEQLRADGTLMRDTLILLREKAEACGCLASRDALRIAIIRVCLEFDIPTTLPVSDLVHGLKVMVPQTTDGRQPKSH